MSSASASFSVAMCTYNGARRLREQLRSIAAQSLLPAELVVADDGSTDSTCDIVADFANHAPFPVRFVRNSLNLGSTKNFEQVIELCSQEFIALSDQDDIWRSDKLARLAEVFASKPEIAGVFSDGRLIDDESKPIGRTLWQAFGFNKRTRCHWRQGQYARRLAARMRSFQDERLAERGARAPFGFHSFGDSGRVEHRAGQGGQTVKSFLRSREPVRSR